MLTVKQLELKHIFIQDNEETIFSNGALFIHDNVHLRSWEIQLMNVENESQYVSVFRGAQTANLEIFTEDDEKFQGEVLVKNIRSVSLGVNIHLIGNGKLHGYRDNNIL